MKVFYLSLLTFLLFACSTANHKNCIDLSNQPLSNSILWKIEGKGIKDDCYLFGTMHLISKDNFIFPQSLQEKISSSEQLVMEIAGMPSAADAMKLVMLKEGSLFDYFDDKQEDTLFHFLEEEIGMNEEMAKMSLDKMKPFTIVQMVVAKDGMENSESYEMSIEKIAKANKAKILGLETAEEQMAIFDNMPKAEQTELVMLTIRNFENAEVEKQKMEKLYVEQNINGMYAMISEGSSDFGVDESEILTKRNINWIPQIKKITKKGSTFIAVGAGHLAGENGVITLLRKEGFTLTAIEL